MTAVKESFIQDAQTSPANDRGASASDRHRVSAKDRPTFLANSSQECWSPKYIDWIATFLKTSLSSTAVRESKVGKTMLRCTGCFWSCCLGWGWYW